MTRRGTVLVTASLATLLSVFSPALVARADIFQWEYINPADPSLGKQQSTTLALDGAGVNAQPGADLSNRYLSMAYLIGMDLTGATAFVYADLTNADLSQADLTNVDFSGYFDDLGRDVYSIYLNGANLTGANLANANFYIVEFAGANLTGVEARGARFIYATLTGANLRHANLTNAILWSVFLHNADLSHANLANAQFDDAWLDSVNLTGADARGALALNLPQTAITTNLIQSNGRIAGLDLTAGASLVVRDYDGEPVEPGQTDPLPIVVEEHLAMDAAGALRLVFDADSWDSTISFATGIPVGLGGTLELAFAPGVDLAGQLGRTIDLFDWTGVTPTGAFSVSSPYAWDLSKLYTTGEVTLLTMAESVSGDFNGDSAIDAADLAAWKAGFGANVNATHMQGDADGDLDVDGADFLVWQRQLDSGAMAVATAAVPEPATLALVVAAALATVRRPPRPIHKAAAPRRNCGQRRPLSRSSWRPWPKP